MKLRNKKTGEIIDFKIIADYDDCTSGWRLEKQDGSVLFYDHIDEIREEWEDYKPKEPLIKDEKVRKAVRAWAEACNLKHATYKQASNEFYDANTRGAFAIRFTLMPVEVYLEDGEHYTIAELCGEVEE